MRIFIALLIYFALFTFGRIETCSSQPINERYLYLMPGYAYQEGRDAGMSPLIYCGNNFTAMLGIGIRAPRSINRVDVSGLIGYMQPPAQPKGDRSTAKAYRAQLDYSYLHIVKQWKLGALRLYAGGSWNTLANLRDNTGYDNNKYNYDFSTSIGPAAVLYYNFNIRKKKLLFYTGIELPLLAFNIRPAYASSIPEGFIAQQGGDVKAFFKSGEVQSFNRFFRLRVNSTLEYILFNQNRILLSYVWDYYSMQKYHMVQMASHQVLLGWAFRF